MSMPMLLRQRKNSLREEASILVAGAAPLPALDTFGQQIKVMPGCQWITAGVNLKGFIAIILATMIVAIAPQLFKQADDSCDRYHSSKLEAGIVGWALPESFDVKGFTKWGIAPTLLTRHLP